MVFVSATVPGQTRNSIGAFLEARFPSIAWLRTSGAHRPVSRLSHEFRPVADGAARAEALVQLCAGSEGRTMVFANSAPRANEAIKHLRAAGVAAVPFHPDVSLDERSRALSEFTRKKGGILVCSGLAARGIDLPQVSLVVEYQMAPNLVEYLHRVGRTARAGLEGKAISLFSEKSGNEAELVKEVTRCVKGGWKYM